MFRFVVWIHPIGLHYVILLVFLVFIVFLSISCICCVYPSILFYFQLTVVYQFFNIYIYLKHIFRCFIAWGYAVALFVFFLFWYICSGVIVIAIDFVLLFVIWIHPWWIALCRMLVFLVFLAFLSITCISCVYSSLHSFYFQLTMIYPFFFQNKK